MQQSSVFFPGELSPYCNFFKTLAITNTKGKERGILHLKSPHKLFLWGGCEHIYVYGLQF
jgi:hypothetical protein